MKLRLIPPDEAYAPQIAAYRREFLEIGSSLDGTGTMREVQDPLVWIADCRRFADPATVPSGRVPATQLIAVRPQDGRLVGMLQIRHFFNHYLSLYGGHIGYSVRPADRRQGVARFMLSAALPLCRELGLERVLITCLDTNQASRRTILSCGGVYENTLTEPNTGERLERYWITL